MLGDEIDPERIQRRLDDLWEIGEASRGGVTRLAYTDEEQAAIDYALAELPEDYHVRTDSIGNVFATRHPDAERSVYVGSHLDTVFNGGRLDGTLGVVAAMEAIEAVHAADEGPEVPPTLTIFRAEESARFGQATIGSRGALGLLTVEDFSALDQSDIPLWQAMQQAGFQPENLSEPTLDVDSVAGFLEMHIEQGRVLDETGDDLGVVTSIRAPARYRATVTGSDDHSGATPMGLRQDAIAGAAEMVVAIEEIAEAASEDGDLVGTVGDFSPTEGAMNKVCGEVTFPIDIRSNDEPYRDEVEADVLDRLHDIADRRGLTLDLEEIDRSTPVELDDQVIGLLDDCAASLETAYRRLPSGGGHDAMNFQLRDVPTGMLFVPSIDGISHNPKEATDPEAVVDATRALACALMDFEDLGGS